jgi:DNA helicase-2/ATP-dependent DNA helicase PcrA
MAHETDEHYPLREVAYEAFEASRGVIPDDINDAGETFPGGTICGNVCWSVGAGDVASLAMIAEESFTFEETRVFFALAEWGSPILSHPVATVGGSVSISFPGPEALGRSVVVKPGSPVPAGWEGADRVTIDTALLADPERLEAVVIDAQHRYVKRTQTVYELGVPAAELNRVEAVDAEPVELGSDFTFLRERLTKAIWHNSYDATGDELVWWWSRKAEARIGASVKGPADVVLADGSAVWIDGGPRQTFNLELVHHETVDLGLATRVPPPTAPSEALAEDQLAAVSHGAGPARIIAPAGSGKTRVLTARMRHLVEDLLVEPEIITAVAYNKRAADEMAERLPSRLRSRIRTIHSLGWAILRMAQPHLSLIDEREQRRRLEPISPAPPRANTDVIGPYLEALSEVRIGLRSPAHIEAERDDVPGFEDTFRKYQEILVDRGEADHDTQIYGAIKALLTNPGIRGYWQRQCRHLLVDEFQDLTPAYLLLLRLVASPGLNVFGVGDDDQVIYGYAGADPRYLIDFETLFPGAGSYALETNYRSPTDVVTGATHLLGYNDRRLPKTVRAGSKLAGLSVEHAKGVDLGTIAVNGITSLIEEGSPTNTIAVLTRVNSSLLPVQVALAEHGIGFQSMLGASVLERTLLRAALAWIRIALEPEAMTRNDLFQAIRRPARGLTRLFTDSIERRRGPFTIDGIEALGADLDSKRRKRWDSFCDDIRLAASSATSTSLLLDTLSDDIGLSSAAAALDATRNLADRSGQTDDLIALQRIAGLHEDPASFELWLRERLATPSDPDGVVLSTVHRVKGLEWDHVVLFGADASLMPHHLAGDIEEERRIFHVAITRGIKTVSVLADEEAPSVFLSEIDGSRPKTERVRPEPKKKASAILTGLTAGVGEEIKVQGGYKGVVDRITDEGCVVKLDGGGAGIRVKWGDRIEVGGKTGPLRRSPDDVDDDLIERLKNWRRTQSESQGVPAFVIFHDTTLNEIAAIRPTSAQDLLKVTGIGPAKLEAYGDELIDLLSNFDGGE